ncbi:hypothetical protein [Pseudomonas sp. PA27(2017)]|uniref:hypothetical protein n=1 Tax=Pseudomonas sp. PA27(2017) TaxID=1932112 RepID=UPI00095FC4D4|nr:hypothetical protein [Pseudomonas sp. PA27(2017)]OLU26451.1 hypothetical protein BVH06_19110 [Pseudomonas sp. PA27(2017)]
MLQAATGKLFTNRDEPRITILKGVIYTNLRLGVTSRVTTKAGSLSSMDSSHTPTALGYELVEYMEAADPAPGILVSRSMGAYIDDFADVASFSLQVICSPDVHIAERLLNRRPRPGQPNPSERLVRFYDESVSANLSDIKAFEDFTEQLIGLRRANYLVVIQAIRTYIAAVHRMSDDLNLAYTLLVMCVESLVQKFDGYEPQWFDIPDPKRQGVDKALEGVDEERAQALKDAVLDVIHPRLGHRFVQFILAHLPVDYFTAKADSQKYPIGRRDLEAALQNLYGVRSSYVHSLKPLTKEFLHFANHRETYEDDGKLTFTFQGLFRLVRAVIIEYVRKAEKVDHEPCHYEWDNPGLLKLRIDPRHWLYNPHGFNSQTPRRHLDGLVRLIDQCLVEFPERKLHHPTLVIERGMKLMAQMAGDMKIAFLGFAYLSDFFLGNESTRREFSSVEINLLNHPSVESLIAQALIGSDTGWTIAEHQMQLNRYYNRRHTKNGIKAPYNVEACMGLALAERYRLSGDAAGALLALRAAVEDFPQIKTLRQMQEGFDQNKPIAWLSVIYPRLAAPRPTLECSGL